MSLGVLRYEIEALLLLYPHRTPLTVHDQRRERVVPHVARCVHHPHELPGRRVSNLGDVRCELHLEEADARVHAAVHRTFRLRLHRPQLEAQVEAGALASAPALVDRFGNLRLHDPVDVIARHPVELRIAVAVVVDAALVEVAVPDHHGAVPGVRVRRKVLNCKHICARTRVCLCLLHISPTENYNYARVFNYPIWWLRLRVEGWGFG